MAVIAGVAQVVLALIIGGGMKLVFDLWSDPRRDRVADKLPDEFLSPIVNNAAYFLLSFLALPYSEFPFLSDKPWVIATLGHGLLTGLGYIAFDIIVEVWYRRRFAHVYRRVQALAVGQRHVIGGVGWRIGSIDMLSPDRYSREVASRHPHRLLSAIHLVPDDTSIHLVRTDGMGRVETLAMSRGEVVGAMMYGEWPRPGPLAALRTPRRYRLDREPVRWLPWAWHGLLRWGGRAVLLGTVVALLVNREDGVAEAALVVLVVAWAMFELRALWRYRGAGDRRSLAMNVFHWHGHPWLGRAVDWATLIAAMVAIFFGSLFLSAVLGLLRDTLSWADTMAFVLALIFGILVHDGAALLWNRERLTSTPHRHDADTART